ncbi:MAG: hypothetical protein QOG34_1831 [Frankiaceae bacterium]|jgi:GNAT superfamily N-acetyltransferase|nr:hypothetical protein [Frankiaceae bacterium]
MTTPPVLIAPVDLQDDELFTAWYDAFRAGAVEGRPVPLVTAHDEMRAALRHPQSRRPRVGYVATVDGAVAGALVLELPAVDNEHLALIEVDVPPAHRRRGVGTALLEHASQLSRDAGRTIMVGEVHVPVGMSKADHPGCRFAALHGFANVQTDDHQVLDLPAAPFAGLSAEPVGYRLVSWEDGCPEDYLEAFAQMRTGLQRDIPMGDLDVEPSVWKPAMVREQEQSLVAQGITQLTVAARDAAGGFAAYTQLLVPFHQPEDVLQNDTYVLGAHRGRGLGTAIKVRNLASLTVRFPERRRVHTWTASDNRPMLKVNAGFGFRTVEHTLEFQRSQG